MPILWRYLLKGYLKIFLLCVSGFISILLVTRFQTIARFAATGASKLYVLKFVVFQIPFILPLAIPISCLIASLLLFQNMSRRHELTALRVSGMGLGPVAYPLIACGILIGLANFTIISEVAPKCRSLSKNLAYEMTCINPLCLLQKDTLIKLKNTYFDMKLLKSGKYAEDVCVVMRNLSHDRLCLMLAKKIFLEDQKLIGKDVTFISSLETKNSEFFDHLVIENQGEMQAESDQLSQYLCSNEWSDNYDYLNLRMLQAKYITSHGKDAPLDPELLQEMARRVSLSIAAFTFTLVGLAYGMEITRQRNRFKVLIAIGLIAFYFTAFLAAKSMKHHPQMSAAVYLLPHLIIALFYYRAFQLIVRGIR